MENKQQWLDELFSDVETTGMSEMPVSLKEDILNGYLNRYPSGIKTVSSKSVGIAVFFVVIIISINLLAWFLGPATPSEAASAIFQQYYFEYL